MMHSGAVCNENDMPMLFPAFPQYTGLFGFWTTLFLRYSRWWLFCSSSSKLQLYHSASLFHMRRDGSFFSLHSIVICMLERLQNKSPKHLQTSVRLSISQSCIRKIDICFSLLKPFKERWLPGCAVWLWVSEQLGHMIICSVLLTECASLPASVRGFSGAPLWHTVWTIRTVWIHFQLGLWASKEHHVDPKQNQSAEAIQLGKIVLDTSGYQLPRQFGRESIFLWIEIRKVRSIVK